MELTKDYLDESIKNFLAILDKEEISSLSDLEKNLDKKFIIKEPNDYILIQLRPSNANTKAYTLSYVSVGLGIPLEIKVNGGLEYSLIIIKMNKAVLGYLAFDKDRYGNIIQDKLIKSIDFSQIMGELENLLKIK